MLRPPSASSSTSAPCDVRRRAGTSGESAQSARTQYRRSPRAWVGTPKRHADAAAELPGSYKLWKLYLNERRGLVEALPLDHPQYEAMNQCFERALVFMHLVRAPLLRAPSPTACLLMVFRWREHAERLSRRCHASGSTTAASWCRKSSSRARGERCVAARVGKRAPRRVRANARGRQPRRGPRHARHQFDRALQSLPITQHDRVWPAYLDFVRSAGVPEMAMRVYRRYLKVREWHACRAPCVCVRQYSRQVLPLPV